jgi:F0F1-type ATP synthase membrane subunit b/b'
MIDGMRADAEADKVRILAAAEAQAVALKKDADERIAAEIDRARLLLAREVAVAATGAAEKLLRDKTTAGDHQQLVSTFITGLASPAASGSSKERV